jgi:5,10-methenyltetrahydromethanopterin hydrogenase
MDEPLAVQITLPKAYEEALRESVEEAARESGVEQAFDLAEVKSPVPDSELQFDPFTIAAGLYVANLIVSSIAGDVIPATLRKLVKKIRGEHPKPPESSAIIVILLPDATIVRFDVYDRESVANGLAKVGAGQW